MGFTTLNLGLSLTIPTNGTRNWGTTLFNTTWTKISNHGHTGSGDGTPITAAALSSSSVTTAKIADNAVTKAKLALNIGFHQYATTLTPAGTSDTFDWNNGNVQKIDLDTASGDVTLTLSNPIEGAYYKIFVIQGATARDLIWPASVLWPQGQKPILSTTDNYVDVINLYYDGTNYFGDWDLNYI